jgi:hypothetical protein
MLNKINEITKLLSYSYTPENAILINNILDHTIKRCEKLYYKTILFPELETVWKNDNLLNMNLQNCRGSCRDSSDYEEASSTESYYDTEDSDKQSNINIKHLSYKTINKDNKNNYILKDITILIYIYVATQPINGF